MNDLAGNQRDDAAYSSSGTETPPGVFVENHHPAAGENSLGNPADMSERLHGHDGQQERFVTLPGEAASPDEIETFFGELASRWTPKDGYQFKLPETLPETFPYDQAFAEEVGGWFKEAGLPPSAAQKLHDRWLNKMSDHHAEQQDAASAETAAQAEAIHRAHESLVREYGEAGSDGYQNLVARADRALTGLKSAGVDLSDWFVGKGALTQADENGQQQVSDPTAVKLLAFIHDRAFAEDSLDGFTETGGDGNPFDTGNPDLKRQSDLLERNPAQARRLIVSAGRDPGLFRL